MEIKRLLIGGQWVASDSGATFTATSPATGDRLAELARGSQRDVDAAVQAAKSAAPGLRMASAWERASWCESVAAAMESRAEDLAQVIAADQGKPLHTEARGEVAVAIQGFRDAAAHGKSLGGETIPTADVHKRVWTRRVPRGVLAVVTPWNFPVNIPTEYLAPALATGNAVVWVPAPSTSLVAVLLAEIIDSTGVPRGAINLVTGEGPVVGDAAISHPGTDAVGFTGSSATGRSIARRAAGKPLLLELGGNGPTIVYADADLTAAAKSIAVASFMNAGQLCSATEVIFAERAVADDLADLLAQEAGRIRLGLPEDPATTMGPLNNAPVAEKVERHIADAQAKGAKVLTGGRRAPEYGSELFFTPTVLSHVTQDAQIISEETFGPVAPVVSFDQEDDMLSMATGPQFGLVSSVWSRNVPRAIKTAERLRTGIVNINEGSDYWEIHVPFGGGAGTFSGLGRLGGMQTLHALTEIQTITLDLEH